MSKEQLEMETCNIEIEKFFLKEIQGAATLSEMDFNEFVNAALNVAVQVVQGQLAIIEVPNGCGDHGHEGDCCGGGHHDEGDCCGGSKHDDDNNCGCGH